MGNVRLQQAIEKLRELVDLEEGLSDWEVKFVDGLARQLEALGPDFRLTETQILKIEQIHAARIG